MKTIRRHSVPVDSFDPNRPLNDLLVAQMEHFHAVEKRLPREVQPTLRPEMPLPSPRHAKASNDYVATMTKLIHEGAKARVKAGPALVRYAQPVQKGVAPAIAAAGVTGGNAGTKGQSGTKESKGAKAKSSPKSKGKRPGA